MSPWPGTATAGDGSEPAVLAWLVTLPTAWMLDCDAGVVLAAHSAHDSPGRHYHTWDHAVACVELLREARVERPRAVFLALLFHDAVYVPGAKDNEARSADLATVMLDAACDLPPDERASIQRMILATADHHALGAALSLDERTMLDLDLAVLGAGWDAYARYANRVEREYVPAVVDAAAFRAARGEFLDRLLARDRLYLTDAAEARWGAAARANLARERAALRAPVTGVTGAGAPAVDSAADSAGPAGAAARPPA